MNKKVKKIIKMNLKEKKKIKDKYVKIYMLNEREKD
jgi:hypothetical protein